MTARTITPDGSIRTGINATGSTIPKGTLVKRTSVLDGIEPAVAATDIVLGVTRHDILDDAAGDVQVAGKAACLASAAIAIGAQVTSAAAGKAVTTVTAGHRVTGVAVSAAGAADELFELDLVGPYYVP